MNLHDWSDKTLVRHAQSTGEVSRVLGVFYERYVAWIRMRACRYLREADAYDVTEQAFLSLWTRIPALPQVRHLLRESTTCGFR